MFYIKPIDTDLFLNKVSSTNFQWLLSLSKLIKETCFFSFATNAPFCIFVTDCSNTSQSWHGNGQIMIVHVKICRKRRLTFFHRRLGLPKKKNEFEKPCVAVYRRCKTYRTKDKENINIKVSLRLFVFFNYSDFQFFASVWS